MEIGHGEPSKIAKTIWLVATPIIFVVGIIGNSISLSVFLHPKYKKSSTTIFFVWLAMGDMMVLIVELPRWWIIYGNGYDIRHYSDMACKVSMFGIIYPSTLSSWMLVALTIERLISVIKPHQMKTLCTVRMANIVGTCIVITTTFTCGLMMYGLGTTPIGSDTHNQTLCQNGQEADCNGTDPNTLTTMSMPNPKDHDADEKVVCSWYRDEKYEMVQTLGVIVQFFISFFAVQIVMTISDIIIIFKLMTSRAQASSQNKHVRQITVTLVVINIAYMVCMAPVNVFMAFFNRPDLDDPPEELEVAFAAVNIFFFSNNAVNFFLYVLVGERFRKQVFDNICGWRNRNRASVTDYSFTWNTSLSVTGKSDENTE